MPARKKPTDSLWSKTSAHAPLAEVLRPQKLDDIVGQQHLLRRGSMLRRLIASNHLRSCLFVGPAGTGKTTLAEAISHECGAKFVKLSAVFDGIAQVRDVIAEAQNDQELYDTQTILFIDEIHRFNKGQQDALLPWVESGVITLIGATTENPAFEINTALLSRMRVFKLQPLSDEDLAIVIGRGIAHYKSQDIAVDVKTDALKHWCSVCNGDARSILGALELAVLSEGALDEVAKSKKTITIDADIAAESIQKRIVSYDKNRDEHYDTISAFIKSVRGSDIDASLYWLAKMILAGEDPVFIARRLVILASEDVGNADPRALILAQSCADSVHFIGMPEAELILSQTVIYLASAPKSNAATLAIGRAKEAVMGGKSTHVPKHLKDAHYPQSEAKGYQYPHNFPGGVVDQQYLPDGVEGGFYQPTDRGWEGASR